MRLFISYAHKDIDSVRRLVDALRQFGHVAWFDEQLQLGQEWQLQLREAIEDNDAFLYAITRTSLASQWCDWEFTQAIKLGKPVIPVLLEEIPFTELPILISSYQVVELHQDFTEDLLAKFRGQLSELAINIPQENAPEVPENPEGEPSRSPNNFQNFTFSGISGGNFNIGGTQNNIESQTNIDTQVVGEKQRDWTLYGIIVLIVAVIGTIATVVALLPETQRSNIIYRVGLIGPSETPTATSTATPTPLPTSTVTPTFTPTPERMPAGQFNVIIAGLGFQQTDGSVIRNTLADDMSDIVFASVRELAQIDNIRGWRSNGVGHILSPDPLEREKQAAQIAEILNADVVVYGLISSDGLFNVYEPEFYVTAEFAALEPELIGADRLGDPVDFVGNSDDQISAATNLQQRLTVLRFFLRGLALYISGNFEESFESFQQAIEAESDGLEVLNIFAGNAAVREPDIQDALETYNQALEQRPGYARALVGRGIVLYRMAQDQVVENPPPYDPNLMLDPKQQCQDIEVQLPNHPQLLAELALRCYREAGLSQDKPPTADIDVKTAFGIGQVNTWRSIMGYGDRWTEAQASLQMVVDAYSASESDRQARIRASAAHANAWLGLRLLSIDGNNPTSVEQAVEYYENALALLRMDVNREYNQQWIELYGEQIAALDDWLADRSQGIAPLPSRMPTSMPTMSSTPTASPTLEEVG